MFLARKSVLVAVFTCFNLHSAAGVQLGGSEKKGDGKKKADGKKMETKALRAEDVEQENEALRAEVKEVCKGKLASSLGALIQENVAQKLSRSEQRETGASVSGTVDPNPLSTRRYIELLEAELKDAKRFLQMRNLQRNWGSISGVTPVPFERERNLHNKYVNLLKDVGPCASARARVYLDDMAVTRGVLKRQLGKRYKEESKETHEYQAREMIRLVSGQDEWFLADLLSGEKTSLHPFNAKLREAYELLKAKNAWRLGGKALESKQTEKFDRHGGETALRLKVIELQRYAALYDQNETKIVELAKLTSPTQAEQNLMFAREQVRAVYGDMAKGIWKNKGEGLVADVEKDIRKYMGDVGEEEEKVQKEKASRLQKAKAAEDKKYAQYALLAKKEGTASKRSTSPGESSSTTGGSDSMEVEGNTMDAHDDPTNVDDDLTASFENLTLGASDDVIDLF